MANLKKEIETYIKSVDETGRGLEVDVGGNGIETTATRITVKMFPEVSSPGCNVGRGTIKVSIGTGINDYLNCGEPSDCRAGHCTDFNESPDCNIHASNGKIWGTISNGLNTYGAEVHTYLQNFDVDVKRPEDVTVSSLNIEQDEDNPLKYNVDGAYTLASPCDFGSKILITFQSVETFCYDHGFTDNGMSTIDRQCSFFIPCECPDPLPELLWNSDNTIISTIPKSFSVTGGVSPYTWSASKGSLLFPNPVIGLSNTLDAGGQCGVITITVDDSCGQSVSEDIRITDNGKLDTPILCHGPMVANSNRCSFAYCTIWAILEWVGKWYWKTNFRYAKANAPQRCDHSYSGIKCAVGLPECETPSTAPVPCTPPLSYCGVLQTKKEEWIC